MTDIRRYQGIGQFGPSYRFMLEHDAHAPGSVDRVLVGRMVLLCADTATYLYERYTRTAAEYQRGSRPELERVVEAVTADCRTVEEQVEAIARFCAGLGEGVGDDLDTMVVGGTEEEIIQRGSDWCADVARVAGVLYQVVGLPARLVMLANVDQAYSGHVIVEVYRGGVWGAVDAVTGVIYRHSNGAPASSWDLMNQVGLLEVFRGTRVEGYANPGQFRAAAISNYPVADHSQFAYTVSPICDYYRSILEMSSRGWSGGLRWLHGEDALE